MNQHVSYLLVGEDLDVASADGPELIPGCRVGLHGVEVLKLVGDGTGVGSHCFVDPQQDLLVGRFLGRHGWRAFGHFLSPLGSSLGKTEWKN